MTGHKSIMTWLTFFTVAVSPQASYQKGVSFLLNHQNKNGSWGGSHDSSDFDILASPPSSFHAFRVATAALCVMALREPARTDGAVKAARDRGLLYLVESGAAKRETPDIIYSIWAHGYALEALSQALIDEGPAGERATAGSAPPAPQVPQALRAAIRRAAAYHLDGLIRCETTWGGWSYFDFRMGARQPSSEPMSFSTASILLNLHAAQEAGLAVPAGLVKRALRLLEKCRKPDGSYLYSYDHRRRPLGGVNREKGSLGRSQVCNLALFTYHRGGVTPRHLLEGLELFFKEHRFLEIGRKRQYPHEAWYATSGYFYYFGHAYAGHLLSSLPQADRERLAAQLSDVVVPHQEADGSWWDYKLYSYHWAYGTAFALMTIEACLPYLKPS